MPESHSQPATADSALHAVAYFGDVSGNGRINASDAAMVGRVAALLDTGFASSLLVDPMVLGDFSGNGRVNSSDASLAARFAALLPVPVIPPIPAGLLASNDEVSGVPRLAAVSLFENAEAAEGSARPLAASKWSFVRARLANCISLLVTTMGPPENTEGAEVTEKSWVS